MHSMDLFAFLVGGEGEVEGVGVSAVAAENGKGRKGGGECESGGAEGRERERFSHM